jgi:hypothetical protein
VSRNHDKTGRAAEALCHTSGRLLWPSPEPPRIPDPGVSRDPQRIGRRILRRRRYERSAAVLTELSAVVVFDASGEHHDRVNERPDADTQQDRKAEETEQGGDESEQPKAQLQHRDLGGVDIKTADAEHAEEELQEAGGDGGFVRQGQPRGRIATEWCLGIGSVALRGKPGYGYC